MSTGSNYWYLIPAAFIVFVVWHRFPFRSLRHFGALPTWALARFFQPLLPETHPWRFRRFTLRDWDARATDLCRMFDFGFWVMLAGLLLAGIGVWLRR